MVELIKSSNTETATAPIKINTVQVAQIAALELVRENTAYASARKTITVLTVAYVIIATLGSFACFAMLAEGKPVGGLIVSLLAGIPGALITQWALFALFDLADLALARHKESRLEIAP